MTDTAPDQLQSPQPAPDQKHPEHRIAVIGAGPAGLTAAYELGKAGFPATVLESDSVVGGISRTVERDGWRFDLGGHRFFTKVRAVEELWHEILPDGDFLLRPRMSRIYLNGKFFDYPLKAFNVLRTLGVIEAFRCLFSYLWVKIHPPKDQTTFEGWTAARFGWRLYRMLFKTYTEKVWGVDATEIQADWAAQRIKNLTFFNAAMNAILPKRNQKDITSLIEEFEYPKLGPGMMWERCTELVEKDGGRVLLEAPVTRIEHRDGKATSVHYGGANAGSVPVTAVISSMPLPHLLKAMDPPVPDEVRKAADEIHFRDHMSVALVVPAEDAFPDNWIYVHDPIARLGRIQNFGAWSPYMVKEGKTCLGLEYFVFEGDELWTMDDEDLIELGKHELSLLGLVDPTRVEAGYVVRMPKAYPTYDERYRENVEIMKHWLGEHARNVHPVGRNGMHKYNNQDHSMYTAMLTVDNILHSAGHDIWSVNVEAEYHEEVADAGGDRTGRDAPIIPRQVQEAAAASRRAEHPHSPD
jgi:protoporphyrinogen oxidase